MYIIKIILLILMLDFCVGFKIHIPHRHRRHGRHLSRHYLMALHSQSETPDDDSDQCGGGGGRVDNAKPGSMSGGHAKNKASSIAQKAAQDAKTAMEAQAGASEEASRRVKVQLAEKALQAAKAAEAALVAKDEIVKHIQQELREAHIVVEASASALQSSQANEQAAMQAAKEAQEQLRALKKLIELCRSTVGHAEETAAGTEKENIEKTELLEVAKNRVELLMRQLKAAKLDYKNTKQAAYKAAVAANEAKDNASRNECNLA